MRSRGFYAIGIFSPKKEINTSNLWRSANAFGANFIFTIGARHTHSKADTAKTPRHIPLFYFKTFEEFLLAKPANAKIIGVECPAQHSLKNYIHPERAIYLLGAEDFGLPKEVLDQVDSTVYIEASLCLNVAVAGSIIMFDRINKC